ncbi:MAG: hypothetical protein IT406_02255 [Candidatus Yanofskybacteria bacterium]|nr:hypothetical protein [Candidatus Yanofskybacteria bacterium]
MKSRFIAISILAIASLFAIVLGGARPATAAFDTTQLSPGQPVSQETSTTLSDIIKNRGLTGDRYKQICVAGNIFTLFKGNLDEIGKRILNQLGGILKDVFAIMKKTLVACAANSILNRFGLPSIPCSQIVASETTAYLKARAEVDLKQSFIARCVVDQQINDITNTIDRMIQEQGPEGGPAWATNWIENSYVNPDRQAYRRFWTLLVNTDICEYMRQDVYNYFDVPQSYRENPPVMNLTELSVDGGTPFPLSAACTAKGWAPGKITDTQTFATNGGFALLSRLSEPQNNPTGFIRLAEAELRKQRATMIDSVTNQLVSGGGVFPVYGTKEESCNMDPDGNCVTNGRIRQAPGVARDLINSSFNAQLTFLNNTNGTTAKAMEDISARIRARMLDMANQPLPIKLELGLEDDPDNVITPTPTPSVSPGEYPPDDPSCTGGNPQCTCVRSEPNAVALVGSVVRSAVERAMQLNPAFFDPPGSNRIASGVNYRTVLQAVCDQMQPPQGTICKPHPGQDDEIVLVTQIMSISVDVITGDGGLRSNGGNPVAACELGVQD